MDVEHELTVRHQANLQSLEQPQSHIQRYKGSCFTSDEVGAFAISNHLIKPPCGKNVSLQTTW